MNRPIDQAEKEPCSHCGRKECVKMGDEACQEGRKKFWENLEKMVAYRAEMLSRKKQ